MDMEDIPEPDRLDGAPHPRMAAQLFGQAGAERAFLDAWAGGRMHHAWLIAGPRGVGKATLAWRIARFLLATPVDGAAPDTLEIDPAHPVARRLRARSESGLLLLRRPWDAKAKKLKTQITAEVTRELRSFFALSAGGDGRRVVIVDTADEMNETAANAVLKVLEEPPPRAVLLLVSHQPAALLPTIRSRCRSLPCAPLGPADLALALAQAGVTTAGADARALAILSGGSAGAAVQLLGEDGAALYADLVALLAAAPRLDRPRARAWAERAGPWGKPATLAQSLSLVETLLARLARAGVAGLPEAEAAPNEAALLARLSPDARAARDWAALQQALSARNRRGAALNLDPAALLLDTLLQINRAATRPA